MDNEEIRTGLAEIVEEVAGVAVDDVTVDKSFVDDLDGYGDRAGLTRAIVQLGQTVRRDVIAEGIESERQRRALLGFGCRLGQGYLFAKPLDHAAATALVLPARATAGPP